MRLPVRFAAPLASSILAVAYKPLIVDLLIEVLNGKGYRAYNVLKSSREISRRLATA